MSLDPRPSSAADSVRETGENAEALRTTTTPDADPPGTLDGKGRLATRSVPIPASSDKTVRHRLNRGGNRQANTALYRIVVVRLRWHQPTRDYLARQTKEGLSKREIIRCLKRYIAREVSTALHPPTTLTNTA
jgi:hypothetical protein